MKGYISWILLISFVLSTPGVTAAGEASPGTTGRQDTMIICMDMMDLDLSGEDKERKFNRRMPNKRDPAYSPELSPFLYPVSSEQGNKDKKIIVQPVKEKQEEMPAKDFSLKLKEISLPQSPAEKTENSLLDKEIKAIEKHSQSLPEINLLGEMPRGRSQAGPAQGQRPVSRKIVIEPDAVPERAGEFKKAQPGVEKRQSPSRSQSKEAVDSKLIKIYERFYKK